MTNAQCEVVFVADAGYEVVLASVQAWQVLVLVVAGGELGLGVVEAAVQHASVV